MQQLIYACRCLLTPDEVSDALFDLAVSLRHGQRPESVMIPVISESGGLLEARLILHPGTELLSVRAPAARQLEDEAATTAATVEAVAAIRGRSISAAGPADGAAFHHEPPTSSFEESYD